ncbi:hypothetical protein ACFXNW_06075 [Nocardia sp. NPDC059180]|uniref:hypothetical protein n=1 Tax=Nocardia sp. NPDC059180 TaxID=3346761 RepID=UPI0036AFEB50
MARSKQGQRGGRGRHGPSVAREPQRSRPEIVFGEDSGATRVECVEKNWTDMRPKSLREAMAADEGALCRDPKTWGDLASMRCGIFHAIAAP